MVLRRVYTSKHIILFAEQSGNHSADISCMNTCFGGIPSQRVVLERVEQFPFSWRWVDAITVATCERLPRQLNVTAERRGRDTDAVYYSTMVECLCKYWQALARSKKQTKRLSGNRDVLVS